MQPLSTAVLVGALSIGLVLVEAGKTFEKYDLPEAIDLGETEFAPLKAPHDNSISIGETEADQDCPFGRTTSAEQKQSDYDWQIIELPHIDPQFDHVDHLPVIKMIDYNWPPTNVKTKHNYQSKKHYGSGGGGWTRQPPAPIPLDARRLFLEKKFHYKPKLTPPANIFKQQISEPPAKLNDHQKPVSLDAIVHMEQPIVTMFANQKTINKFDHMEQINEIHQQQDAMIQSIERDNQPAAVVVPIEGPRAKSAMDVLELNYAGRPAQVNDELAPVLQLNRARESFQAAAELAKQLELDGAAKEPEIRGGEQNRLNSIETSNLTLSTRSGDTDLIVGWDTEATRAGASNLNSTMSSPPDIPKYLGYGQMYKSDNARSTTQQARLSCSFGVQEQENETSSTNVTISDVQWVRFLGNYDPDQLEPPFECKFRSCRTIEVTNDIWTTVHPRPAVQQYLGERAQMMPSYSVTIHQVDPERHIGVYRCSATRQIGQKRELVYRIVPFS